MEVRTPATVFFPLSRPLNSECTLGALLLPASDRDRLVVLLLQDIEASLDRSDKKARLSRKGVKEIFLPVPFSLLSLLGGVFTFLPGTQRLS